jgi:4-amino-4-deoxy-L-arabinose transferase-like glycosyltransferase
VSDTPTSSFERDPDRNEAMVPEGTPPADAVLPEIGWAVLIVATLYVCYFSQLGAMGFVGPDEPRYAWIARTMAETGDWVTPRLYGAPWFEKPVLYYWGAALSFKIFGVSEAAARLPSAVSALLATLALGWLAARTYGAATARWVMLLLPSGVGMIGFSHAAATDMPFSGMLTVAMVCAAVALGLDRKPQIVEAEGSVALGAQHSLEAREEAAPLHRLGRVRGLYLALVLFGFFLGLAVLAKGPAAIILSGGAVFFWAIFTKRWRDAFRLLHPVAIVAFCATALPWYILCARRNPDFFRVFIIEHNFKRFLTPEFQHVQPVWYYVPVLLVALLPWTGTLLWSVVVGLKSFIRRGDVDVEGRVETGTMEAVEALSVDGEAEKAARLKGKRPFEAQGKPALQEGHYGADGLSWFLVCWAGFCVIFFSASRSKLPGYVLPAIPAIGLLLAHVFAEIRERHRVSFRIAHLATAGSFFVIFTVLEVLARKAQSANAKLAGAAGVLILAFAVANLIVAVLAGSWRGEQTTKATETAAALRGLRPALLSFGVRDGAACAVIPVLAAMLFANALLPSFFQRAPSGRTIARELQRQRIPANSLSVVGMKRGLQYSVSFYLHEDIKNWDAHSETGGYLLTPAKDCGEVVGAQYFCELQRFDSDATGRFLYLVIPIASGK